MVKEQMARTAKDKWRAKEWYRINAPPFFGNSQLGETLADSPDKLIGRVIEATAQDLTGDFSRMHIKIQFQIHEVKGNEANTRFAGHELTADYMRRLARKYRKRIETVCEVSTKDGARIILKPAAIVRRAIQGNQITGIRNEMARFLAEKAAGMDLPSLVRGIVDGTISSELTRYCRKIYPIETLEVRRSEVVVHPEHIEVPQQAETSQEKVEETEQKAEPAEKPVEKS